MQERIALPSELTHESGSRFDPMALEREECDHLVIGLALRRLCRRTVITPRLASIPSLFIKSCFVLFGWLWGMNEDARDHILEDIHKVDPQVVVTKIYVTSFNTGNLHVFLDNQPASQQIKLLQQEVVNLELFSGWVLPEELADFTNKLAQQNLDAYKDFVKYNTP